MGEGDSMRGGEGKGAAGLVGLTALTYVLFTEKKLDSVFAFKIDGCCFALFASKECLLNGWIKLLSLNPKDLNITWEEE